MLSWPYDIARCSCKKDAVLLLADFVAKLADGPEAWHEDILEASKIADRWGIPFSVEVFEAFVGEKWESSSWDSSGAYC